MDDYCWDVMVLMRVADGDEVVEQLYHILLMRDLGLCDALSSRGNARSALQHAHSNAAELACRQVAKARS